MGVAHHLSPSVRAAELLQSYPPNPGSEDRFLPFLPSPSSSSGTPESLCGPRPWAGGGTRGDRDI